MAEPTNTSKILSGLALLALIGVLGVVLNALANTAVDKLKAGGVPLP